MATHYMARQLGALGHDVKQVPAAYAKPFRQVALFSECFRRISDVCLEYDLAIVRVALMTAVSMSFIRETNRTSLSSLSLGAWPAMNTGQDEMELFLARIRLETLVPGRCPTRSLIRLPRRRAGQGIVRKPLHLR